MTHTGFDYQPKLADWKNETDAFVVKSFENSLPAKTDTHGAEAA